MKTKSILLIIIASLLLMLACNAPLPFITVSVTSTHAPGIIATPTQLLLPAPATVAPAASPLPLETLPPGSVVGERSIGDPYTPELGNTGYDVQKYTLKLALDTENVFVSAKEEIQAISMLDHLAQISLDFTGYDIRSLEVDGQPASYTREGDKLVVNFPKLLADRQAFSIHLVYSGTPVRRVSRYVPFIDYEGLAWVNHTIYAMNEPDGAHYWYACNDHPQDKATYRFELSVPSGMNGVANGHLVDTRLNVANALGSGKPGDVYVWEHNFPTASAFVTVAVGKFQLLEGKTPKGVALRSYIFPEYNREMTTLLPKVGEALDWMSATFVPYAFEAFGYVNVRGLDASLEDQTMVLLDISQVNEDVMVHELAHQWFGDLVSLDSWADIWRSEGFATYVSIMWATRDNRTALDTQMSNMQQDVEKRKINVPLNNPAPADMFGYASYVKGAVVVHQLRLKLGDQAFFTGLRSYFTQYAGKTASHAQFQQAMESASGMKLDEFFKEWFK